MNIIYLPTWATAIFIIAVVVLCILKWFPAELYREYKKIIYYVGAGVTAIGLWFILAQGNLGEVYESLAYQTVISIVSVGVVAVVMAAIGKEPDKWPYILLGGIIFLLLFTLCFCNLMYGIIWLVVLFILFVMSLKITA